MPVSGRQSEGHILINILVIGIAHLQNFLTRVHVPTSTISELK